MPRGYRGAIIAAIGCLTLAAANPPKQPDRHASAHQRAKPTVTAEPTFRPYPDRYSEDCYKAGNHDTGELCAEWRSAVSSEKAAREAHRATNWAIVATVLSLIGVGSLIWTIWQTSGSLKEARRANRIAMKANARASRQAIVASVDTKAAFALAERNAQIAADQLQVSIRATEESLRAYVVVKECVALNWANPNELFRVSVVFENQGNTPAKNVYSHVRVALMEGITVQFVDLEEIPFPELEDTTGKLVLGAKTQMQNVGAFGIKLFNGYISSRIHNADECLVCYGFVVYNDIRDVSRTTTFFQLLNRETRLAPGVFSAGVGGNYIT